MNLKLRFALLFTFFVAVILLISCITIYILFYNARYDDYYRRAVKEGNDMYNIFMDVKKKDEASTYRLIKEIHDKALFNERLYIIDSAGAVIFRFPDTMHIPPLPLSLAELRTAKEFRSMNPVNKDESVALYMENTGSYVFVTGYDRQGFLKLKNLRLILVFVFFAALVLSAFVSFLFVREAVRPLKELALQMQKTNVQNLTERVDESTVKDEINEIARNFNGMLERLSKAFEFQKNFVFHASHELRTPLATMLSLTESALNRNMTEAEYKQTLSSLKEEQQELIELTNSLLLISQFEQMGYVEDWPLLRIDEVIYETVSSSKKIFGDLDVNITFAAVPEEDDDFVVRGNESILKSAFSNLIKNAYIYSVDHKVNITLDADGKTIFVHLDNAGTQLPADEKESIMVPFFRGGNALKTKGYGLGLSMVYRFIAIHKGTVTYTPIANDVNRFTVTLNKAGA
ncbi:HAMP domain-containing protein [Sediminibacterium roseum]|uniref:histidine kinase n=1 Tax=Sediminibacterium roseum TaxID=1978412 RepID=A0ABW9ZV49_9BACT|nr:sensor histidine kinase [Sediminibacterium roseum]NCI51016.1 HAMP domain-containing protein [Sediminibacterium roseum]